MSNIANIAQEFLLKIKNATQIKEVDLIRIELLGKNGLITNELKKMVSMDPEEKKIFGKEINRIKQNIADIIADKIITLKEQEIEKHLITEKLDVTLPIRPESHGRVHPITQTTDEIINIFAAMGFSFEEGPDIENDYYNFTALNIGENHPARQMHDSFYLAQHNDNNIVLRTHTSPVQIRSMQKNKPPYKIITAGRTYRCDYDMTHTPMFHQVEGLYIDKNINMGHLKWCVIEFLKRFFMLETLPVYFRTSFFPFTEPSAEMDIGYAHKNGELVIGGDEGKLEIGGCGMVHPNVLRNVGIDPDEYQGFAFGMGIERLTMLKYGISDLRTFFENDIRWLNHYNFAAFAIPGIMGGFSQ